MIILFLSKRAKVLSSKAIQMSVRRSKTEKQTNFVRIFRNYSCLHGSNTENTIWTRRNIAFERFVWKTAIVFIFFFSFHHILKIMMTERKTKSVYSKSFVIAWAAKSVSWAEIVARISGQNNSVVYMEFFNISLD